MAALDDLNRRVESELVWCDHGNGRGSIHAQSQSPGLKADAPTTGPPPSAGSYSLPSTSPPKGGHLQLLVLPSSAF